MTKGITFLTAALGCAILSAAVQAESNVKYTQTISQATNPLSLTIVATNELHDFNHVWGCNYEKDLHL